MVSSVIDGFRHHRLAAREAIEAAGGIPILVNEDFPSSVQSPRNACLDAVDSADYLVTIIGTRGGWTAPSGKLVVEEEYERALSRKLPVLAFIQEGNRDLPATAFAQRLSDYVDGRFRRTFTNPESLRIELERALRSLLANTAIIQTMPRGSRDHFSKPYSSQHKAMVRIVLTPERAEEVIDPVRLASSEFVEQVYAIGHRPEIRLLSYRQAKESILDDDSLVVMQPESDRGRHGEGEVVRIQIFESGELVIDANVTGRVKRGERFDLMDSFVMAAEDVEAVLAVAFRFCGALYDEIDKFQRHQRFHLNVCLSGLGYRTLQRNPQPRASHAMRMDGTDKVIVFDEPRLISRSDLSTSGAEINRILAVLTRKVPA